MGSPSDVSLVDAWCEDSARDFFLRAWPMYVHDLSAFDSDFYQLDASGRWLPDIAGDWVARTTRPEHLRVPRASSDPAQPFQRGHVINHRGQPVGFACVGLNPFRYMPEEADVILAEFFLVHRSRGIGVAQHAIQTLIARYPGHWALRAIHDNARAIRFWRKTLPALGLLELNERTVERDVVWDFVTLTSA
jgi:predicted acetyltransferase